MRRIPYPQKACGATERTLAGAYMRAPEAFVPSTRASQPNLERRASVAACMRRRYQQYGLTPPEALDRFTEGATVWTAGHQLVAAGGTAFFHYKILSMLRRSRTAPQLPVVVFWLASEDHDWEEVRHFPTVLGRGAGHAWPGSIHAGAVGRWEPGPVAQSVMEQWMQESELAHGWKEDLVAAFGESKTLAEAMFRCVHGWFGDEGVLVLDADDKDLKAIAQPLWDAELTGKGIAAAVEASTAALEAAGWKPGLHGRDVALFELREDARIRLEATPNGVRPLDGKWAAGALPTHGDWSPNAALRPIYQEWLLQSDAVFLGPSELAYWLQLPQAFAHHDVVFPRLELRDGGLFLDAEEWDWLEAQNWHPSEGRPGVENRWAARCMEGASLHLPEWDFAQWAEEFAQRASSLDPTLDGAARAAVKKMEKAFDSAAGKVRRAWRLSQQEEDQLVSRIAHRIAPNNIPQERAEHVSGFAEAWGGWKEFKASWIAVECDEPAFIVWVAELKGVGN